MATELAYAIKYVGNMQEAIRFHRDELGSKLRFESPHGSEFQTGGTTLALHLATPDRPAGTCELGFRVPDIAASTRGSQEGHRLQVSAHAASRPDHCQVCGHGRCTEQPQWVARLTRMSPVV
jgi:catechol 2,3-dioxygenase-like lactoylglutathione lyase family enzyme